MMGQQGTVGDALRRIVSPLTVAALLATMAIGIAQG
jgi:hypothetical protein